MTFKTSSLALLPPGQRYAMLFDEYGRDFGEIEDITVVVEGRTLEESKAYASRLVREIRRGPVKFQRIAYRIDPKRFEGRALLYLSTDKLREIRDKIFDHQEFMENFAATPTLDQLITGINTQIASAFVSHFFDLGLQEDQAMDLRFLKELVAQISERLDRPTSYRSPWSALFTLDKHEDGDAGYFLSDDKQLLFILVEPASKKGSFTGDQEAINAIRSFIAALRPEFPSVQVGVTGSPALSNDEMTAAFRDSEGATLLAFALTLALLLLAFKRAGKPILMLVVLAVSLAWSMGVTTLVLGHLTIFSVMFIPIVIGIGIDYGIYFLFRYEEELFLGRNLLEALELTAARSGPGILLGALTAAGTFYVLTLTDFRGISELGFIAGTSIILAWLSMMTFFPALLVVVDRRHASRPLGTVPRALELEQIRVPLLERLTRYPRSVLMMAGVLSILSLWAVTTVGFDYNLLNLQAKGTESVLWEKKILAKAGRSGFAGLASADTLDELRRKHDAFDKLPSVSEVDSVLLLIPENQGEKAKIIRDFAPLVAPVRVGMAQPVDLEALASSLETLKRRFDLAVAEADQSDSRKEIEGVLAQIGALLEKLGGADRDMAEPALTHLQAELYQDFVDKFHFLQRNLRPRPVSLKDVPDELRRKFIGKSGRFLIQIHPGVNIWDREGARRFVRELRSVDPDVTGSPVITYEAIGLMEKAYLQGTVYAFLVVGVLSFLMLRRLRESILALIPLGLGMLWTVGLMHLFDLKFNLANVWGIPLIVGTAAEYGLNVVIRYMEGRRHGGPLVARSTVMAVIVNGLTTIVGFGSLMIADHRGIFGLGLLLTIGASASLASSLIVLPVLIRHFGHKVEEESKVIRLPAA
ncbi:MAG: MMPL family transporter [Candidatus Rokubacteria bacterium]|nr:MMPL family transporter [Candidatus Rokubacteria bacterium]